MTTKTSSPPEHDTPTSRAGCCCAPMGCWNESARDILDRRFANGELTKEQYEEFKREIEKST